VGNLTLVDAFALFGGKPLNRLYGLSAMAADGAMILSCSGGSYRHPARGVLRYEDRLSRETERLAETQRLGEHLALARDGNLPIRMIVVTHKPPDPMGRARPSIHVRLDLVGKLTEFDGDHFIVDFVRAADTSVKRRAGARA
jgi:hypothetical protein